MVSLDILCFNPFHLKNKMMKIGHKKISCGLSKISKNVSWPINICLKCFMAPPQKILCLPPTYLMCGPLLEDNLNLTLLKKKCKAKSMNRFLWPGKRKFCTCFLHTQQQFIIFYFKFLFVASSLKYQIYWSNIFKDHKDT